MHFARGDNFVHFWTSHIFFWGRSNACIIFTRKMPSTADFQWWLKVWILMQTDSFAYTHLGAGPLIFIYYSPWQHVQSVCRFPSSFNFQWMGRLQLVVLSSAWIKEEQRTGSLWDCSCSGKMRIHFTLVGCEQKLRAKWIQCLIVFLLWGTFSFAALLPKSACWVGKSLVETELHLEKLTRTDKLSQR